MASAFETFYILYKLNADGLKQGVSETKSQTDKLNQSLSRTDVDTLKVNRSFNQLTRSLTRAITGFIGVGAILGGLKSVYDSTLQLQQASEVLDVNAGALDAWSGAVERAGGTSSEFQGSLKSLATNLGVTNAKALDLLPRLADSFSKIKGNQAQNLGKKLGIDEKTILLLQRGRKEVEAIIQREKDLGVVTKRDTEVVKDFNQKWKDTARGFKSLFITVGSELLPMLSKLFSNFGNAASDLKKHSGFVIGALIGIGIAAAYAAAPLLITTAIVGGLVAAVALLYEDISAFINGTPSLLGDLVKKFPEEAQIIIDTFKAIRDAVEWTIATFEKFAGKAMPHFEGEPYTRKSLFGPSGGRTLNTVAGPEEANTMKNLQRLQQQLAIASTTPLSSQTSNSIFNSGASGEKNISVQTGPITVNTQAANGEEVGSALSNGLLQQMKQAIGNFDDGVVA